MNRQWAGPEIRVEVGAGKRSSSLRYKPPRKQSNLGTSDAHRSEPYYGTRLRVTQQSMF